MTPAPRWAGSRPPWSWHCSGRTWAPSSATTSRPSSCSLGPGRDVAVKLLRPEYGRDPDFLARFRQEAQSVAQLNHPNIVGVYDYGQDPSGPFIVMELIDGEDLASILRRTGPLPPRQAARIA